MPAPRNLPACTTYRLDDSYHTGVPARCQKTGGRSTSRSPGREAIGSLRYEPLAVLTVDVTGLASFSEVEYELAVTVDIPASRIKRWRALE